MFNIFCNRLGFFCRSAGRGARDLAAAGLSLGAWCCRSLPLCCGDASSSTSVAALRSCVRCPTHRWSWPAAGWGVAPVGHLTGRLLGPLRLPRPFCAAASPGFCVCVSSLGAAVGVAAAAAVTTMRVPAARAHRHSPPCCHPRLAAAPPHARVSTGAPAPCKGHRRGGGATRRGLRPVAGDGSPPVARAGSVLSPLASFLAASQRLKAAVPQGLMRPSPHMLPTPLLLCFFLWGRPTEWVSQLAALGDAFLAHSRKY